MQRLIPILDKVVIATLFIFGSAAAVLAFLAGGLFESNYYDSEVAIALYFIMALPFPGTQNNFSITSSHQQI